jgi:hypothetical protein
MPYSQAEILERFHLELGDNLDPIVSPETTYRWINDGKNRLGARYPRSTSFSWAVGVDGFDLPADFYRIDRLTPRSDTNMPSYRIFGRRVRFQDPDGARSAGGCFLDYWALYPDITDDSAFVGEDGEAYALVSYMLHRFYVWLASSRTDYRRYSTITGQNGVRFEDLADVANSHLVDFRESGSIEILPDPLTYYGE